MVLTLDVCIRMASSSNNEPSNYMQVLTQYLSNIMNSVLLGLPAEIKELIYFDALSHASAMILVSQPLLSPKPQPPFHPPTLHTPHSPSSPRPSPSTKA